MKSLVDAAIVFVGAGTGGVVRYGVQRGGVVVFGADRPWATMAINVVGSLLIGLLFGWLAAKNVDVTRQKLFLLTGVLGGFTTFSAFSLDALRLWQSGSSALAAAYVVASVVLALVAVAAGVALTR